MTTTSKKPEPPRVLLCALVRDGRDPPLHVFVDECFKCHRAVWRSEISPRALQAICRDCVRTFQREGTKMVERPMRKKAREALAKHQKEFGTEASKQRRRERDA